jgi:hypothetical protein
VIHPRTPSRTLLLTLALAPLALACVACSSDPSQGYSFATAHRADVQTIAVPVFTNDTFAHGTETRLAEAIVTELRKTTPYRVTSADTAQTVLSGTITGAELLTLTQGRQTGLVEDQGVRLTVSFTWKDRRSGRTLVERRSFSAARSFVPARGIGERLEDGQNATVQDLARAIVAELRSGW